MNGGDASRHTTQKKRFLLDNKDKHTETHKDESPELKEKQKSTVGWRVITGGTQPINAKWLMQELVPTSGRGILSSDIIKSSV